MEFIDPMKYMRELKKKTKFYKKLFSKVNLPAEFIREKYNLNCESHIYKIKTMT